MYDTYHQLKTQLEQQGTLSEDDITAAVAASGPLTAEERAQLDAEVHERRRQQGRKITMNEYLAASKVLDSAAEGSDEYNKALKIVETYESGG